MANPLRRTAWLYAGLLIANAVAWIWAVSAFRASPVLLGAAMLAWLLGLRHALDADHIAAIDNVTRRRIRKTRRTDSVGLAFSLGHCTVVAIAAAGVAVTSAGLQSELSGLRGAASAIGTAVSAFFLLAIAAVNLGTLRSGWRALRAVKEGREPPHDSGALVLRGFPGALLRPLLEFADRFWQVYLVGFLFGLGFDTASEIGLLALSASQAGRGLPLGSVMIFPALFTAAMALLDTTDGVLMARLYGWAFASPLRTLRYNLGITFVSAATAVLIGGVEAGRLFAGHGGAFLVLGRLLDAHSARIGAGLVLLSLAALVALLVHARLRPLPGGAA